MHSSVVKYPQCFRKYQVVHINSGVEYRISTENQTWLTQWVGHTIIDLDGGADWSQHYQELVGGSA